MDTALKSDQFASDIRSLLTGEGCVLAWDTKCCVFCSIWKVKCKILKRQREETA